MERVLVDKVMMTDYGQLDLAWGDSVGFDGDFRRYFTGQTNGLVGAAAGDGVYLNLARRWGGSPVRIVERDSPPGDPEPHWEDVVEVSFTLPPASEPRWCTWAGQDGGDLDLAPGTYRLRVSARGRDAAQREGHDTDVTLDAYLVEIWPAPRSADAIVRSETDEGRYWHDEMARYR